VIKIFSLPDCEIIGILNRAPGIKAPILGSPRESTADLDSDEAEDEEAITQRRKFKSRDYRISKVAKKGVWHQ
jgi:hypothetical protein